MPADHGSPLTSIDAPPEANQPQTPAAPPPSIASGIDPGDFLQTDASDLPRIPVLATGLLGETLDPDTACERLAEIVAREPVLAARVLRLVNSAYFGLSQKVTDIRHAVFLLGYRTVRTVALTAAVFDSFKDTAAGPFDLARFWLHGVSVAAVCHTLARRCRTFDPETAFSVGLLHDIGKLLLVHYRLDEAQRVIAHAEEHRSSFYHSEQQLLPVTHPELGGWLAHRWGLPPVLVNGIAQHHAEVAGPLDPLAAAVRFANYLCAVKGLTTSGSFGQAELQREAWAALALSAADVPRLIDVINDELKTAESLLTAG